MSNGKVILAMALLVAGSLVASVIVGAFAGGIAGYLVARLVLLAGEPIAYYYGETESVASVDSSRSYPA